MDGLCLKESEGQPEELLVLQRGPDVLLEPKEQELPGEQGTAVRRELSFLIE